MIIPIRCFTCSMVIADKYRYYQEEVRKRKLDKQKIDAPIDTQKVLYLTKEFKEKTVEGVQSISSTVDTSQRQH